jgi:hypothetical protein
MEINANILAIAFYRKDYVSIVDRTTRSETKQIKLPSFTNRLASVAYEFRIGSN